MKNLFYKSNDEFHKIFYLEKKGSLVRTNISGMEETLCWKIKLHEGFFI